MFPLFRSPIDLAHAYWRRLVQPGDTVVDATCGNGQDTQVLAELVGSQGCVYAIDIQLKAIESAKKRVGLQNHIIWVHGSHEHFPDDIVPKLIVYNLGYLPGHDKTLTTQTSTTLLSIQNALSIVASGGALSITCYPGHPEGAVEEAAILEFSRLLTPSAWNCCFHSWPNRSKSPSLLFIQKSY